MCAVRIEWVGVKTVISGQGAGRNRLPERRRCSSGEVTTAAPAVSTGLSSRKIRTAAAVVWALVGLASALMIASLVRVILDPQAAGPQDLNGFEWVAGVTCTAIGGVVAAIHAHNKVAWLLLWIGTISAVSLFIGTYAPTKSALEWVGQWIWWPEIGLLPVVFLLFPDGRLPSNRWRFSLWISVFGLAVPMLALASAAIVQPGVLFQAEEARLPRAVLLLRVAEVGFLASLLAVLLALIALVVRFRASSGDERQQLKWLLVAAVLVPVAGISDAAWGLPVVWLIAVAALPVAVGVAIMKYGLYQIDPLINRSLVYGGLTAAVLGVYVSAVTIVGTVLQNQRIPAPLIAAGTVAVAFQPVRDRLQRAVNRMMYGERDDPYAVLSRLGQRLEGTAPADDVLPVVVETIANAFKVPYVAIELRDGEAFAPAAATGKLPENPLFLPLTYQGEQVGRMVVGHRGTNEPFSEVDVRLLADIARQAGVAAHAVRLTADLQRSRERLVTTREEERRRLRRDLHDGLGAALAGVVLQLGAARTLLVRDPNAATQLLDKLRVEVQDAITDIRRLVYDLRPPQLDELGLVGAIQELVSRLTESSYAGSPRHHQRLHITVEMPTSLPPLQAAVEVAAYRIAAEALTNVVRHAEATSCVLHLACRDMLMLEIRDDGRGFPPDTHRGVGLTSMRERAAELGGDLRIESGLDRGTVIHAELPNR
jgi:signal transduction histidine kinase